MRLANGIVALEFDGKTGSLVQIEDLRAGIRHPACGEDGRSEMLRPVRFGDAVEATVRLNRHECAALEVR
jgi:hypothetical protein